MALEKPVREKEKEEEAIRAGKQDPESTARHDLSASVLAACSVLPVAKECSHSSHTETTSLHIWQNTSSKGCWSRCLAWATVTETEEAPSLFLMTVDCKRAYSMHSWLQMNCNVNARSCCMFVVSTN